MIIPEKATPSHAHLSQQNPAIKVPKEAPKEERCHEMVIQLCLLLEAQEIVLYFDCLAEYTAFPHQLR